MDPRPRVAVVGGGISGLATASYLCRPISGPPPDVVLIEDADRLGGKILTRHVDGVPVDTGPDAFLARVPAMRALVEELGLGAALIPAAPLGAYLWSRGRLRRLPPATAFGVPDRLLPLLRSRLLSPPGVLRAGLDMVLPRRELSDDPTVAEMLRPRFGRQLVERLVEPLIGGVHAGTTDRLSAPSTVPDLEALARAHRSLYLALRRQARERDAAAGPTASPSLVTLEGGLGRLVDAVSEGLHGAEILTGFPVTAIERTSWGFRLTVDGRGARRTVDVEAVVLATPASVTAELLEPLAPAAAEALRNVPYVDVATVTLTYPHDGVRRPLDATGFLVPPAEGRLLVGSSWLSAKWPHLSGGPSVVFRGMVGRAGDRRWTSLDDDALVRRVHDELAETVGLSASPRQSHVQRWPGAIPQYTVGHRARLEQVDAALARLPGLHVTGAAYRGAGVAACVAQAERTAATVLAWLGSRTPEVLP